jgi:hypothetical protein
MNDNGAVDVPQLLPVKLRLSFDHADSLRRADAAGAGQVHGVAGVVRLEVPQQVVAATVTLLAKRAHVRTKTWDRCYDFVNIFAPQEIKRKIFNFDSK